MYLIQSCVCGGRGPFVESSFREIPTAQCACGVSHQRTTLTCAEYEAQYCGAYHASEDRHAGCVPYVSRYGHDFGIARKRLERYRKVFGVDAKALRVTLDVGCATGAFVDHLRLLQVEAYGVDPDPAMKGLHVCTGSITAAPMKRYDLITLHDVLEHLVDPLTALQYAAHELLAPGGALIVDVPDVSTPAGHHHYKAEHLWYFTADSLIAMAAAAELVNPMLDRPIPGKVVICARRAQETQAAA